MNEAQMLQQQVIAEFSSEDVQENFVRQAMEGLWDSEKLVIEKFFTNRKASVLDVGCGTGRTTLVLKDWGYDVRGQDIAEAMIINARKLAEKTQRDISYDVGDATALPYEDNSFEYVLFSNQGWSQIPGKARRLQALQSMRRVLKPGGILIFTAHPRVLFSAFFGFWVRRWFAFHISRLLGRPTDELDYGDRFFEKGTIGSGPRFGRQYIHIPAIREVRRQIHQADLKLVTVIRHLQISQDQWRKHPPVFFVCTV